MRVLASLFILHGQKCLHLYKSLKWTGMLSVTENDKRTTIQAQKRQ